MEHRLAVIAIIISDREQAARVNALLHDFGDSIVGRMGLPYHKRDLYVVSVVLDAANNDIAALSGKLGRLSGVAVKVTYAPEEKGV